MTRRLLAAVLAATAPLALAQSAGTEAELGGTHEALTNGYQDWNSLYLDAAHSLGDRRTLYGGVRETERFGQRDSEARLGYYHPFGADWTALGEGSASGEHHVLPRYSLFGQLAYRLVNGWSVSAGLRHSEYNSAGVNIIMLGAERYWGNWRGAYTLYNGHPEGAPSATAHRVQLSRYYGERSNISVAGVAGREVENLGSPAGIVTSDVRALSVLGRHWISAQWAVSWELLTHRQGNLYTRRGLLLGLRHRF